MLTNHMNQLCSRLEYVRWLSLGRVRSRRVQVLVSLPASSRGALVVSWFDSPIVPPAPCPSPSSVALHSEVLRPEWLSSLAPRRPRSMKVGRNVRHSRLLVSICMV